MTKIGHSIWLACGGRQRLARALRRASMEEQSASVVMTLLDQGALVDAKDPETGRTALMIAVDNNCRSVIVALLSHSANIHRTANNSKSALDIACEKASQDIVDLLVDGARANREYKCVPKDI